MHNKYFRMQLQQEYVEQVNLVTSSCKPNSEVSTISTSICCRSSCTTVHGHLVTEHCTSSTSMDRDITTTAVSKWIQAVSIRDDTSCHRRYLKGQYSNKQLTWTSTTASLIILQVRPHHTWQEARQMIDNVFANSYMHLLGQTIGNIDQDVNFIKNKRGKGKKGKGKRKKGKAYRKGKGYNNYYNYNHYNSYYNNQQQQQQQQHLQGQERQG